MCVVKCLDSLMINLLKIFAEKSLVISLLEVLGTLGLTTKTYKHINHFTILSKVLVYTHLHLMKERNENLENY